MLISFLLHGILDGVLGLSVLTGVLEAALEELRVALRFLPDIILRKKWWRVDRKNHSARSFK